MLTYVSICMSAIRRPPHSPPPALEEADVLIRHRYPGIQPRDDGEGEAVVAVEAQGATVPFVRD